MQKYSLGVYILCSVVVCVFGLEPPYQCHSTYYTNPRCIDHPDGYGCECGPGFHWNTYMCMSSAIDSRFEFKAVDPPRYTLLLNKAFPRLDDFTISFWINVSSSYHPGTILSYTHNHHKNLIRMTSGPTLRFEIFGGIKDTNIKLIPHQWYHITWTWTSRDGHWTIYINGDQRQTGYLNRTLQSIPSGGEIVLGQSAQPFQISTALDGDLSHLNIWNYVMGKDEVKYITKSCNFMYCGNAVQWVEFRSGTRGPMKIRWPSGIFTGQCFTERKAAKSCDTFCSDLIGAQCNEEIKENIKWMRTKAELNITVDCPSSKDNNSINEGRAVRVCNLRENANDGIWEEPLIDGCISDHLLEIKNKFRRIGPDDMNEILILQLADELLNHTENNSYSNPIDIATVIDLLQIMIKTQEVAPKTITWQDDGIKFASAKEVYPSFELTETFSQILGAIINNLLSSKNDEGWNATQPAGVEGDNLLVVMHLFADVISRSLIYHVIDGLVSYKDAVIKVYKKNIELKIETFWIEEFYGSSFPSSTDQKIYNLNKDQGFLRIRRGVLMSQNASELPVFIGVSSFRYPNLARNLPNKIFKGRKKEDRVNTPIMAVYLHIGDFAVNNVSSPILVDLPILDTFNISNPECVRVIHKHRSKEWYWSTNGCRLLYFDGGSGTCACHIPGVFSVTTDMYDVNWDKGEKRPHLMNFASYIGCAVSATLCLVTFIVHVYIRTSSATAALHKNLSLSISFSQIVFMFGIDRYDQPVVCQVFAVLLHFFFLSNYAWLMNEAFNLYIVITYSAHSQTDLNDSGSMLRYHILGWVIPGILVGAFIGTNADTYYAEDMCWISWDHFWLFIGPAVGIIAVSILVLIFTAKEHNENSYTKSEKTNKIIMIHMKGLWTQLILVTVCWAFAFISIKMVDQILKYIYALFNCLQGAFFMVFYMLLHEEVRGVFKSHKKKQTLVLQGYDFPDEHSLDSNVSSCLLEKDKDSSKKRHYLKSRKRGNNEEDKGSDCEMITSV